MSVTKVAHLSSAHPYFDTRLFHRECKTLHDAGYEVHLIAQHTQDEVIEGIHLHGVAKPVGRLSRMLFTPWDVYKKARAIDPEIYHLHDPELLIIGRLLAAQGKRVVFDAHEDVPAQILTKDYLRFNKSVSRVYAGLEAILLNSSIRIIIAEHSYLKRYGKFDPQAVTVLNYPVISPPVVVSPDRDGLVYIGSISRDRGICETVEALRLLRERHLTPHFHCIGAFTDTELENEVMATVRQYGLTEQITFHGRLNAPAAFGIAANCQLGLSLSHPVPNNVGSYPTKMFEYMMLSLPFVVSDIPLYTDAMRLGGETGVSANPQDPNDIADGIAYLLTHPEEAAQMGQCGRKSVETNFNWATEAKKLLTLYDEMLTV